MKCSVVVALDSERAATPISTSPSSWSFISEMSGEITSVSPGMQIAGIW